MADPDLQIRPGEPGDEAEIMRIWRAASRVGHPFLTEADLDAQESLTRAEHLPRAEVWLATNDHHKLGFIALLEDYVGALFVDPDAMGRGVGSFLLEHAKAARSTLTVSVYEANTALAFYKRHGFMFASRDLTDEAGRDLPVLNLRWPSLADRMAPGSGALVHRSVLSERS